MLFNSAGNINRFAVGSSNTELAQILFLDFAKVLILKKTKEFILSTKRFDITFFR